jgi:exodeoxyribonuclease VII small subunit
MTTDAMDFDAEQDRDKALPQAQHSVSAAEDASIQKLSFKEASDELEGIVRLLEGNQLELEDALHSYERGVRLLRELQTRLADAQQQVSVLMGELGPESTDEIDTTLS